VSLLALGLLLVLCALHPEYLHPEDWCGDRLRGVLEGECRLQRMRGVGRAEPFNGADVVAVAAVGEGEAGIDGLAVHQDGAGPAGSPVADTLGAREGELVAEEVEQCGVAGGNGIHRAAIQGNMHVALKLLSSAS
jgi:hypothetical protein